MSDYIGVAEAVKIAEQEGKPISRYAILKAIRLKRIKPVQRIGERVFIFKRTVFIAWLDSPRKAGRPRIK